MKALKNIGLLAICMIFLSTVFPDGFTGSMIKMYSQEGYSYVPVSDIVDSLDYNLTVNDSIYKQPRYIVYKADSTLNVSSTVKNDSLILMFSAIPPIPRQDTTIELTEFTGVIGDTLSYEQEFDEITQVTINGLVATEDVAYEVVEDATGIERVILASNLLSLATVVIKGFI